MTQSVDLDLEEAALRKEHRDSDKEDHLEKLAKAAFAFFIASMFFGLIGVFFKCPYIPSDANTFFFQKFLQTFLMAQYIAFWLLYNAYLPTSLLCFLREFFDLSISWHKIFEDRTEDDYEGNSTFDKYFFYKEHRTFYQEDVYTSFLVNFTFVMILQAVVLFIYILVKVAYIVVSKKPVANIEGTNLDSKVLENNKN